MTGPKKLFSVQLSPENYGYLSDLAYSENHQWPLSVDKYLHRMIDEMRASSTRSSSRMAANPK